jgi:capsular polysaccharide biosynthesis protein
LNGFEQVKIDQPALRVHLKKCFVPSPSFAMGNGGYADVRHLSAPRRVSERLTSVRRNDGRPVYLSRSKVPDRADRRDAVNETELEARLASSSVLVVHPQELTLVEQVEMINTHSVFIGPCGSALHSILFCLPDHAITTFVLTESFVPAEYLLVDAIVDNEAHYLEVMYPSGTSGDGRKLNIDIDATLEYLRDFGVI